MAALYIPQTQTILHTQKERNEGRKEGRREGRAKLRICDSVTYVAFSACTCLAILDNVIHTKDNPRAFATGEARVVVDPVLRQRHSLTREIMIGSRRDVNRHQTICLSRKKTRKKKMDGC